MAKVVAAQGPPPFKKDPEGIRESDIQQRMTDIGDARTLGPIKAAYVVSPSREAKNFRWNVRRV